MKTLSTAYRITFSFLMEDETRVFGSMNALVENERYVEFIVSKLLESGARVTTTKVTEELVSKGGPT